MTLSVDILEQLRRNSNENALSSMKCINRLNVSFVLSAVRLGGTEYGDCSYRASAVSVCLCSKPRKTVHYDDVIMSTMASQITSLTVVYSAVYSDANQRKHQSSASLAFVWGIHRDQGIPRTKGQLRGKCLHLITSSCTIRIISLASGRCNVSNFKSVISEHMLGIKYMSTYEMFSVRCRRTP